MSKHPRRVTSPSSFKAAPCATFCLAVSLLLSSHALLSSSLAATLPPPAQSAGATLSGTVFDEDGAVIEGAGVTAFNPATGLERRSTTNREGYFVIPLLPAGSYSVTVQRDGFKTVDVRDVSVTGGSRPALRIKLLVGSVHEYVVVTAEAAEALGGGGRTASVPVSFGRGHLEKLPLSGGTLQALVRLVPGAVVTRTNFNEQGQFSVGGQRPDANYFTVDGVSANFGVSAGPAPGQSASGSLPALSSFGGTNSLISVDAVQEVRVNTSTYAAEYGRTPGAQISFTSRSGTEQFRGAAFYNLRRGALDANDWFVNAYGLPKPPSKHDGFGGVLGGPVVKGRTFFFVSYEGLRAVQPRVARTGVPSAATRELTPPRLKPLIEAFPAPKPTGRDLGFGMTELAASYGEPSSLDAAGVRLDQVVSGRLTLFGRYAQSPSSTTQRGQINPPTPTARATFGSNSPFRQSLSTVNESRYETRTLTLGASYALGPRVTGDARFNWSRARGSTFYRLDDFGGARPAPASYLFPPYASPRDGLIQIVIGVPLTQSPSARAGQATNLRVGKDADNVNRQLNAAGALDVARGAHRFKLGLDWRRLSPVFDAPTYTQTVSFRGLDERFTDGTPVSGTVLSGLAGLAQIFSESAPRRPEFHNLSLFAQDAWQLGRRLTFSYGVRWELNPPPRGTDGQQPAVLKNVPDLTSSAAPVVPVFAPAGAPLWKTTYGNFAPRVGLAYQPRRWPAMTLRAGFGVYYDLGAGQAAQAFGSVFPFTRGRELRGVPFPLGVADAATPSPADPSGFETFFAFDGSLRLPYARQWSATVERRVGANYILSASYLGAQGRRLLRADVFFARPTRGSSSQNVIVLTTGSARSDYRALQAQLRRRLSKGFEALASYTLSRSTDTASDDSSIHVDVFDPRGELGPSDFDVRHSVSAALTYDVPTLLEGRFLGALTRRWSAGALVWWRTATPVDVTMFSDIVGGGLARHARPDVMPGAQLYVKDPNVPGGRYVNPRAFVLGGARHLGRNALRGFGASQLDATLGRGFKFSDRFGLQLRLEVYNLLNHPNFANPTPLFGLFNPAQFADPSLGFVATQTLGQSLGAGGVIGGLLPMYQIGGARSVQIGLKLHF